MATVTATLRLKKLYFESSPAWTTWEDMQITAVKFYVEAQTGDKQTFIVDGVIGSTFITASVVLQQTTTYKVYAVAYSPYHTSGFKGTEVTIDSDDTTTYYNLEATIIDKDTGRPVEGATFTLDPAGTEETIVTSREDGLIWIQRKPAGTYSYTVSAAGYDAFSASLVLGGLGSISGSMGYIQLTPTV